jgi:hypothetical protein
VVQNLVRTTIERYMLNRDLDTKNKIYLVNPNYLQSKTNALMTIPGEIGFTVRMGLFTGLREEELYYIHDGGLLQGQPPQKTGGYESRLRRAGSGFKKG